MQEILIMKGTRIADDDMVREESEKLVSKESMKILPSIKRSSMT